MAQAGILFPVLLQEVEYSFSAVPRITNKFLPMSARRRRASRRKTSPVSSVRNRLKNAAALAAIGVIGFSAGTQF